MDVLTRERAKPALAYGGNYQLIDFALSSVAYSHVPDVWISVQYQAGSLDPHIAGGRPWDLDRTEGGYRRLVPEEGAGSATETGFSTGNADNLLRSWREIAAYQPNLLIVMSADHVFHLDLRDVVDRHREWGAECTVVTSEVTKTEARNKAVIETDGDRVVAVEYKPDQARTTTVATEIFVYDPVVLGEVLSDLRRELVGEAEDDDSGLGDFGEHLLPRLISRGKVYAFAMPGYWRDLGRPEAYLAAHRDLLADRVDVFKHPGRPIMTRRAHRVPARVRDGGSASDALLSNGCDVRGEVRGSVLGPGVVVESGAVVVDSVLGQDVRIEAGAQVHTSVVDDRTVVGRNAQVGARPASTRARDADITLVGVDSRIGRGAVVPAGGRLEPGTVAD